MEPVEHQPDELLPGRVRQDAVVRRPEVALQRCSLREVQPGVIREKLRARLLGQVIEVLDVHRQAIDRLELGGHLFETEPGPQVDVHLGHRGRVEEGGDQLVWGHGAAQDEFAGLETAGQVTFDRDEDEGTPILEETLVLELLGDRRRALAGADDESDLVCVVRGGLRQPLAEILADEIRNERHRQRARRVGRPVDHRAADDRPQDREEDRQHDRGQDQREQQEPERAADPAAASPAAPGAIADRAVAVARGSAVVGLPRLVARLLGERVCLPCVARSSAGADGHRVVSMPSSVREPGSESVAARASSSSWRMIAAASRSTRAR